MFNKFLIILCYSILKLVFCVKDCYDVQFSITQKVENEGFHRDIKWLLETPASNVDELIKCNLALHLNATPGFYVYPDQIADLDRLGQVSAYVSGDVNIESPAHESTNHDVYVFVQSSSSEKISLSLPIHLRYQRAQITGGYGKVVIPKPSLLMRCPEGSGQECRHSTVNAPCDSSGFKICTWSNISYQALFDEVELFVPIGDLDDYPIVSVVTLLLGCAGCIYILSVLSTTSL